MKVPKIKICGLTREEEAEFLNEAGVDYAGFVFFEKSRRNVSFGQAERIRKELSPQIQCVAVTVSPDLELCRKAEAAGFDFLQAHGKLEKEVLDQLQIPLWRAYNIEKAKDLKRPEDHEKIAAYLVDAGAYGSGQTFDWQDGRRVAGRKAELFHGKMFVLAGGLHVGNVAEGVRIFEPDAVDVSSGVEGEHGKERRLVLDFARRARGG